MAPTPSGLSPVPVLPPRARWTDFFLGAGLPFKSVKLLFRSKALFLLALASSGVTLFALVGLVALLSTSLGGWVSYFWARPESWYGMTAWYLVAAATFVICLVVGANTLPLLLLAPLQDPMSEATEELCGGFTAPKFSLEAFARGTAIALVHTVKRVAFLLGGHLLLLPLNFIPGVGSVLWTGLGAAWTMWWLAGEYLSGPMARHFLPFGEVRKALGARRPIFPLGRDIGYLPGDVEQKLNPWMQPIFDNVEFLMNLSRADKKAGRGYHELIDLGILEIEPLTYIRGRSIPNQFIIVDEAQNLTPHEVKTIITRVGDNTKIVLTGDPFQIDNPYVDSTNNGLVHVVNRFKAEKIAGHITMTKGERSVLAELAANLL